MPYARSKAARLREFQRLGRRIRQLERDLNAALEARSQLLLDDDRAPDRSSSEEIGTACGLTGRHVRKQLQRLRAPLTDR